MKTFVLELPGAAKWLAASGLSLTLAGVVRGLFERIFNRYRDIDKYPYGPPSNIAREIIDNPETPIRSWLRTTCYFELRTGFWLIVLGTILQIWAVWA
jgi:hypothetical protein